MGRALTIFGCLIFLSGCAYISHTTVTVKADKAKALLYGSIENGDVKLDRTMCVGFGCKQEKGGQR